MMNKKIISWMLSFAVIVSMIPVMALQASAKTAPNGETVNTILFYAVDSSGDRVLISQIPVKELAADHQDLQVHNYSVLDRYVTTVHQEATGLTVSEFVEYAQGKTGNSDIAAADLRFTGSDQIAFWEIDQTDYDSLDTYTYEDLYGTARYNFPEIYKYWNYRSQDYYDPEGVMSREEVIDHLMDTAVPEQMLLSVTAFSQRYMVTDEKYENEDYNMENYWSFENLLDTERTIRLMIPMTEENLREKQPTASNTRYWVSRILLNMSSTPSFTSEGIVAKPTAVMTEDENNYYVRFYCETEDAVIYFNHNYQSPSYMPTCPYDGDVLEIPKDTFKTGTVTLTAHAVKDGWADEGVVTLTLTSSGTEPEIQEPEITCGEGGSYALSEDGSELTITPDEDYEIKEVTLNGTSEGTADSLTGLKTGDSVVISFEKKVEKPEIECGEGGSFKLSEDGTILTILQDEDYEIEDVILNGTSKGDVTRLTGLKTGDRVKIIFKEKAEEPEIAEEPDIYCGKGGSANLSDDGRVLTITPDDGYEIKEVLVNDESRGAVSKVKNLKTGDKVVIEFEEIDEEDPSDPSDPVSPSEPEPVFSDVADDAWYAPAVKYVAGKGYFKGTSETEFSPDLEMTRAMFVTVLSRIAGIQPEKYAGSDYQDVPEGQWYSAAVKWASQNGIVNGIGGGRFDPDGFVTREQMAAIMYRYADFCGLDMKADDTRFNSFTDHDQVSAYAKDAMIWTADRGIINGTEKGLEPGAKATRAQVAQIVKNYAEKTA